ncbi:MAG: penicillin-binding protein activator [Rickettsiaceae bacterium]
MPLSGPEAELGKEYAQMMKMGLSDSAKTKIRVSMYDSASEETLNQSVQRILDQGTDMIIGPIYSEPTKIIADKVKGKGTIVLSLSNNPVLADKQVYVYGHAPMRQLEQLTNYLLDQQYQNYIALLPSGRHSTTVSKVLKDIITSKNGTLARVEFYGNEPADIEKSLKLVSDTVDNLNENDFNLTQPVVLLADDQVTMEPLLASAGKFNLGKKSVLAGDSRIDVNLPEPIDVTFTGSLNFMDINLPARAEKAGIKHLSFLHAIAYDAGKMIGEYIGNDYNKLKFLARMNSQEPFMGVSGNIHFVDSIAQRKYDIIKKENGQYIAASNASTQN